MKLSNLLITYEYIYHLRMMDRIKPDINYKYYLIVFSAVLFIEIFKENIGSSCELKTNISNINSTLKRELFSTNPYLTEL